MTKAFIALDWGTTSFRAYHVDAAGKVIDQVAAPEGIMAVKDGAFEAVLEHHIGAWDKALPVVASGMITSRQGWVECAYVDCPAGAAELAKAIHVHKTTTGRAIHFITGLHHNSASITHDVLRGEETQVFDRALTKYFQCELDAATRDLLRVSDPRRLSHTVFPRTAVATKRPEDV